MEKNHWFASSMALNPISFNPASLFSISSLSLYYYLCSLGSDLSEWQGQRPREGHQRRGSLGSAIFTNTLTFTDTVAGTDAHWEWAVGTGHLLSGTTMVRVATGMKVIWRKFRVIVCTCLCNRHRRKKSLGDDQGSGPCHRERRKLIDLDHDSASERFGQVRRCEEFFGGARGARQLFDTRSRIRWRPEWSFLSYV